MTEHTEELKQEILANILSTNHLSAEDVKSNWRYDEETDENWLSLYYPVTVGSSTKKVVPRTGLSTKKKTKTNMCIIKSL